MSLRHKVVFQTESLRNPKPPSLLGKQTFDQAISNLCSLQYLNLASTWIKSLPVGLKKLRKLIYLNLEFTHGLESLVGIATTLPNLQVLKLFYSSVCVDDKLMEELQHLEHLKILTATIEDATILERIQGIDRLASCIRGLCLRNMSAPRVIKHFLLSEIKIDWESKERRELSPMEILPSTSSPGFKQRNMSAPRVILSTVALGGLQYLSIVRCNISIEIKIDWESRELSPMEILPSTPGFNQLSTVFITELEGQRDLSWLLFAQNLKKLYVSDSAEIEEIINKEKGMSITKVHPDIVLPFGNLESLELHGLPELKEICWNYRTLPNLREFDVRYCPKLPEDIANFLRVAEK